MVRKYGPFRERFEEYILERTTNHLWFPWSCSSRSRPQCVCGVWGKVFLTFRDQRRIKEGNNPSRIL